MIVRALLVLVALLQLATARADEPDPLDVLMAVRPARERWLSCAGTKAAQLARTQKDAELIADIAIQRCRRAEEPVARILRKELGPVRAKRVLDAVRIQDRTTIMRALESRRRD